ncbi:MAG: PAS domain S-box protein [Chloroflexia bacterium]|nr:PAS domain S-box protein [Chloroflexia bacterium]
MVDITEQKRVEEALKESELKNRALSEATEEALFFSDKGVCIECNKAACEMFGYKYEELIGIFGTDVIAEESKEIVRQNMMTGYEEPYEAIAQKKDGTKFWAEFHGRMYEYKGKEVRVTAINDISDRKVAEEALVFSEEKFRAAFKTSPDSISINRMSDGKYVEINEGFMYSTGYSEIEVLGKTAEDLNFWVNKSDKFKLLGELTQKGYIINFDAKFRLKGGKIISGLMSARIVTLNHEKYLISITRDISELKKAGEELIVAKELAEKREKEYRALFTEMLDGFALHEVIYNDLDIPEDYRFVELNPAYERLTGLKKENIINKTILEVRPNIEKKWIENFGKVGKTGEPYWFEDYVKEFDKYYTGLAYSPQQDYFAVIFSDVTDKKKAEKIVFENDKQLKEQNEEYQALNEELTSLNLELLEAKQKAEESDKLKTAFLANMSHEIRTPMNGIMGFSGLLAKDNLVKEKKQKYIEIIKQNSHQLLSIINDLVDISKIEAGQIDIEEDEVRLDLLSRSLADLYYQKAIDKNIDFHLENKGVDILIKTDETKLRQILINLLDNAFKFTHKGEIKFGYEVKESIIEFFVSDTGIGIDKESTGIIFERFRQVELSSARKYGGTGLGLSISKAYIEKMGGKIWVDSEINRGSTFVFTLPLEFSKGKITHIQDVKFDGDRIDWSSKVILVAEDELVNYKFFEEIFEGTKVNLIWAINGQEAVEHCMVNETIDLVLMDIKMPVLNGYDATEKIKKYVQIYL